MAEIKLKKLSYFYEGKTPALCGVDLTIKSGDFVNILGESGSGKTTLLKIVAGLLQPSAGQIFWDGNLLNGIGAQKRDVAFVTQEFTLYPQKTVFENIMLALDREKLTFDQKYLLVQNALNKMSLGALSDRFPKELSFGQKQKVALLKALVRSPQVVLFDEPLSNLDVPGKRAYCNLISEAKRFLPQSTYLYVTHSVTDAQILGNKTAVLQGGKLLQYGNTRDVFLHPSSIFVARQTHEAPAEEKCVVKDGSECILASDGEWHCLFRSEKEGGVSLLTDDVLCAPATLTFDSVTLDGQSFPLGEWSGGVLCQGDVTLEMPVSALTAEPCEQCEGVKFKCKVSEAEDGVFALECFGKKWFAVGNFSPETQTLCCPFENMTVTGTSGNKVMASYLVTPCVCQAKVLSAKKGIVKIGKRKFSAPAFNLPKGAVRLNFPRDAFSVVKKGGLAAQIINFEDTGGSILVYAFVEGFEEYCTMEFQQGADVSLGAVNLMPDISRAVVCND